jgi:predicted transcriptional regulator
MTRPRFAPASGLSTPPGRRPPVDPVLQIQAALTERDHLLLSWLADHGVLTSEQIATALYPSIDSAQRRLKRLTRVGVLGRFRPQKADGGSFPYHYVLDQLGVDVVAAQRGEEAPRRTRARDRRRHLTSRANLPHLLGVNQFFTDLSGYARTHPDAGTRLERWWPASRCQEMGAFVANRTEINPAVWGYRASVRPDGHGVWTRMDGGRPSSSSTTPAPSPCPGWSTRSPATPHWSETSLIPTDGRCCSGCTQPPGNATSTPC